MVQSLVTGVDIGHHSIKAVVLKPAGDKYTLLGYREIYVTDDIFADNYTLNYQKIVKKLKELKKGLPRFSQKVVIAIPDNTVISKVLQIDSELEVNEQEFAIHQAFSHQSPFPIEELRLDFAPVNGNVLNTTSKEKMTETTFKVYATKREVVESRTSSLVSAGFSPILADIQSHSLVHLWQLFSKAYQRNDWMLVDVGKIQTTLCLDMDDKPPFVKHIPAGITLPEENENISEENENSSELPAHREEYVQSLIEKITKQIQMFTSVHGGESLAGIWLCGGGASFTQLPEQLSDKINLPCEVLEPFTLFHDKSSKRHRAENSHFSCFATAAGLALRGFNWLENDHVI